MKTCEVAPSWLTTQKEHDSASTCYILRRIYDGNFETVLDSKLLRDTQHHGTLLDMSASTAFPVSKRDSSEGEGANELEKSEMLGVFEDAYVEYEPKSPSC